MSQENVSITLDSDLLKRLEALAEETERNRSWLVRQAIQAYLEELEDLKLAKERLHEERLSPSQLRKAVGV